MSFNPNKLNFKVDQITGDIIQPQIFLCDRQLNKKGEIYPFSNLRIKAVLNGADEISFTVHKNIKIYNEITDYSVVLVKGFGYFEVSPTINDTYTSIKTLNGNSLGESELSQLHCTLECNTDDDITSDENAIYIPTILYNKEDAKHSLIDRILTYAPNYSVGHVDDSIKDIQRTFSFKNSDIISCFSEIAEEMNCIFDVVVKRNDDGILERIVNIYDAQYCNDCGSRNIINGICQNPNCGSSDIGGIGEDTTILISTDNLSDEITLTPDGNMKNCFIVEGGDDIITITANGLLPSDNGKIYMFSPETMSSFSKELQDKYKEYLDSYNSSKDNEASVKDKYAKILETEYNIIDLILYLQSGRMPSVQDAEYSLENEVQHLFDGYHKNFPKGLGITPGTDDTASRNSKIRKIFSIFLDDGYAIKQEGGNYNTNTKRWTGDLIVQQIKNIDTKATIHVGENSSTIEYSDSKGTVSSDFCIKFTDDDESYESFIKQEIALVTETYEYIEDQGMNNPKEWQKYSLNRLYSYLSGYQLCIETLNEVEKEASLDNVTSIAKDIRGKYVDRINEISYYMKRLKDIIYHLYYSYYTDESGSSTPCSLEVDSNYEPVVFEEASIAFANMFHYIKYGTWSGENESKNTDYPLCCADCNSTSVTLNGCNVCKSTNIITYADIAESVHKSYLSNQTTLENQRKKIQNDYNIKNYLDDETLYKELMSYVREDVYTNSNFISDGLENSNSALLAKAKELIQKAEQELAKACVSQHTLSGNVYAFVAYSSLDKNDFPIEGVYDKFKLGNFMRYFCDDKEYKLRLSSEEFSWTDSGAELNVEFTDVIHYLNGGISDIASLMQAVNSLSTSFDSVKKQAEQGQKANNLFSDIKKEGLYSSLGNVLNARNQEVQIDDKGITLRKYDYDLDDYSPCQMKLINRNIIMTDDNWESAKLAIGLGKYNDNLVYGVWADLLVGDLIVGKELKIRNDKSSFIIDETGISLKNSDDEDVFSVNTSGEAYFKGEIKANSGEIAGLKIYKNYLAGLYSVGEYLYHFSIGNNPDSDPGLHYSKNLMTGQHAGVTKVYADLSENQLQWVDNENDVFFVANNKGISFCGNVTISGIDSVLKPYTTDAVDIGTLDYRFKDIFANNMRLKKSENYGGKLNFGNSEYVYLHEYEDNKLRIKAKNILFQISNVDYGIGGYVYSTSGNFKCYKYHDGRLVIEYRKKLSSELAVSNLDGNTYYIQTAGTLSFPIPFKDIPMVLPGIGVPNYNAPFCKITFDGVSTSGFGRAIVWTQRASDTKLPVGTTINGLFIGRWK